MAREQARAGRAGGGLATLRWGGRARRRRRPLTALCVLLLGLCGCASDDAGPRIDPSRDLFDPNAAVRTKAVHQAVREGGRSQVPRLIELLDDSDPGVRLAAGRGLRTLTGRDTGYRADLLPSERREQVLEWRAWYSSSPSGPPPGSAPGASPGGSRTP